MTEFVPCRNCKGKAGPKKGFFYVNVPYGDSTAKGIVECDCHKAYVQHEMLQIRAMEADIWPAALDYNIDAEYKGTKSKANVERLRKYVFEFDKFKSAMVYIYGPNGTQKTTLAHWIGANVLRRGYTVKYMLMQNLLVALASGFEEEEKIARVNKLKEVDLLIIDESFSKDKVTIYDSGYQLPYLDRFLRERFEMKKKGIVFISNKNSKEIESQKFSRSIQDFVIRNTVPHKTDLEFVDNYMLEASNFSVKGLFD
jgi:DNA replication protein DnaC